MEGVGDGVNLGGLGGYWDPVSLTVIGDALFPCWLVDLGSILLSVFESVPRSLKADFSDVATSASLSAAEELCWVSLCAETRKLLCNTDKREIFIQEV